MRNLIFRSKIREFNLASGGLNLRNSKLEKFEKSLKTHSKPVYMAFPGAESIQFDLEKLFLLAVSKENLV